MVIVCLPTPLKKNSLKPDMSYVFNCAKKLEKFTKKNQTIILESTVYPGASKKFAQIILKNSLTLGKDIFLGYSP